MPDQKIFAIALLYFGVDCVVSSSIDPHLSYNIVPISSSTQPSGAGADNQEGNEDHNDHGYFETLKTLFRTLHTL